MSESSSLEINGGRLQDFTIDQMAGSAALIIGSIGALLTIIWQSRCLCKCRVGISDTCYLFDCTREPPPIQGDNDEETEETLVPPKATKKTAGEQPEAEPEPEPEPGAIP
jgi:hypothetical protein